ncbi:MULTISPECIES: hypothetical protein, partial [Serratia]|uniref:hypothetical protein n=1 Tax=Serratia TaxID=613 RepID=UPI001F152290
AISHPKSKEYNNTNFASRPIFAIYSTYFIIFYDWPDSPPEFSWIHDGLMTILSIPLSSALASYPA